MSVINNVLKDLESRSSQFTPIDIAVVNGAAAKTKSKPNFAIYLFFGLIVFVPGGFYYYQNEIAGDDSKLVVEEPSALLPDVKTRVLDPPEVAVVEVLPLPNQIIDLQIKETSNQLSMEFLLREKAVSYLKERSENSFIYHLKDVGSEIPAPLMKGNQWVEKLSINKNKRGIDVIFKTASGVLVNTEQKQLQNEAVWIIKLEKPQAKQSTKKATIPRESLIATNKPAEKKQAIEVDEAPGKKPVKVQIKTAGRVAGESAQLSLATSLVNKRQWKNAETLLLGLLDGPQDMTARKQLLGIYTQPQYAEKYAVLARQSSERYPQQDVFKTEYARSLFQMESYQMAISLLQTIKNKSANQLALMAASYQRIDQHDNAILYYQRSLELNRRQARSWIGLGISLEHQEKPQKALKSYQTAAKIGNINARLQQFIEQRSRILKRVIN